jgi:hypothetical protein
MQDGRLGCATTELRNGDYLVAGNFSAEPSERRLARMGATVALLNCIRVDQRLQPTLPIPASKRSVRSPVRDFVVVYDQMEATASTPGSALFGFVL